MSKQVFSLIKKFYKTNWKIYSNSIYNWRLFFKNLYTIIPKIMTSERPSNYNWANFKAPGTPVRERRPRIEIDNETWRDGMQGTQVGIHPSVENRAMYLLTTARNGYSDHFDIGFPASGSQQKADIIHLINFSQKERLGLTFSAAGRAAVRGDVQAVLDVAESTGIPVEADLFLDPSSLRAHVEGWNRNEMIQKMRENIAFAKKHGLPVMFVPERASVTSPEQLFDVCRIAADEGADRIGIADTTGVLTPQATSNLFRGVMDQIGNRYPDIKLDFHEHDDLQMGIGNCVVAVSEGVDRLHATSRGIGERAGNVALEQLLVVLNLQGFRDVDTHKMHTYTQMAADLLSVPLQSHEPLVGPQAFETASGVHASTIKKDGRLNNGHPPIYFPISPESVGLKATIKIGPMSGRANVTAYCAQNGIGDVSDTDAQRIVSYAKERWALLSKNDVLAILGKTE
jgi:2-isopropylmalate synthase